MTILETLRNGRLAGASEVRLTGLTEFPKELYSLADTLEVLDLSGNALTALPDDLGRLHKLRILFCSGNQFLRLPPSLGGCPALSQIGFRGCGVQEVPSEALPPSLRWLTLTDNRIETLPTALGQRPALQKLMLAGNRLHALPAALEGAGNLELLRLSANGFDTLPGWLTGLPRLAWLGWAGNPLDGGRVIASSPIVPWDQVHPGELLGEGASGRIHQAMWSPPGVPSRPVALKLYKAAMTSDGLPEREMEACLAAGEHPNLVGGLGRISGHPGRTAGLLMPLLPPGWRPLAGPPSPASCSRDIYNSSQGFDASTLMRLARGTAAAAEHLHRCGLLHGDLYAHNILWDGIGGEAMLSDFGAASPLPPAARKAALQRLDVLAWGILLGELLDRCPTQPGGLRDLQRQCTDTDPASRPLMADVMEQLDLTPTALHL